MSESYLLDTNVWLDYFLPGRPGHDDAAKLVALCEQAGIDLYVAGSALGDFYFLFQQSLKRLARDETGGLTDGQARAINSVTWSHVDVLLSLAGVVGIDYSDAWIARKHGRIHNDFEDNLIIAAALRSKASKLVTNDRDLLRDSPVATVRTADAVALLQ